MFDNFNGFGIVQKQKKKKIQDVCEAEACNLKSFNCTLVCLSFAAKSRHAQSSLTSLENVSGVSPKSLNFSG